MTTYDPFNFVFDRTVAGDEFKIAVTVVSPGDGIQLTIRSGIIRFPLFLETGEAADLAAALRDAVQAASESLKTEHF